MSADLGHRSKGAQAVDQNRNPGKIKELLGGVRRNLPRRHAGAEARGRKNDKDTHKKPSIPGHGSALRQPGMQWVQQNPSWDI